MNNNVLDLGSISFSSRLTDYYDEEIHSHNFYEIFIVTAGAITHVVDKNVDALESGDAFLICPGTKHRFIRREECTHRDFLIGKELFKTAADYIDPAISDYFNQKKFIRFKLTQSIILALEEEISTFFEAERYTEKKNFEKVLTCQLIGSIYADLQLSTQNTNNFKSKCITLFNENANNPHSLQIICKGLGYSYVYFCKKFKKEFNTTPTEYLNSIKIKNAAYLLLGSNYSVQRICEQIGFLSMPYFIKLFKNHFGVSPSEYRRQHLKNK